MQTLFISAAFNLRIKGDLGKGINMVGDIKLTNNSEFMFNTLTPMLYEAVGRLEFNELLKADAIFYKIVDVADINNDNGDDYLIEFHYNCNRILTEFWLVKDNAIDMMLGYVEFPYINPKNIVETTPRPIVRSNLLQSGCYTSNGDYIPVVFDKEEIEEISRLNYKSINNPLNLLEINKTNIRQDADRLNLAQLFIQAARQYSDLGMRISQYCSALECIFSTDTSELSHKLAERIAFFLAKNKEERYQIFNDIKSLYSIRSQIVHGSPINKKKILKSSESSKELDKILRRVFNKIINDSKLSTLFMESNNKELETFFKTLVLG